MTINDAAVTLTTNTVGNVLVGDILTDINALTSHGVTAQGTGPFSVTTPNTVGLAFVLQTITVHLNFTTTTWYSNIWYYSIDAADIAADINAANITNITASVSAGGNLTIENTAGNSITIVNGTNEAFGTSVEPNSITGLLVTATPLLLKLQRDDGGEIIVEDTTEHF